MIKLGIPYGILEYTTLCSTFLDKYEATEFIFAYYRLGSDNKKMPLLQSAVSMLQCYNKCGQIHTLLSFDN